MPSAVALIVNTSTFADHGSAVAIKHPIRLDTVSSLPEIFQSLHAAGLHTCYLVGVFNKYLIRT